MHRSEHCNRPYPLLTIKRIKHKKSVSESVLLSFIRFSHILTNVQHKILKSPLHIQQMSCGNLGNTVDFLDFVPVSLIENEDSSNYLKIKLLHEQWNSLCHESSPPTSKVPLASDCLSYHKATQNLQICPTISASQRAIETFF